MALMLVLRGGECAASCYSNTRAVARSSCDVLRSRVVSGGVAYCSQVTVLPRPLADWTSQGSSPCALSFIRELDSQRWRQIATCSGPWAMLRSSRYTLPSPTTGSDSTTETKKGSYASNTEARKAMSKVPVTLTAHTPLVASIH